MDIAKKRNIVLKQYQVNVEVFYRILEDFAGCVKKVKSLDPYYKGYEDSNTIYFDGYERLICLEHILDFCTDFKLKDVESWKQVVVRMVPNTDAQCVAHDVTGTYAWSAFNRALRKVYTAAEIDKCLNSKKAKFNFKLQQYHYRYPDEPGRIMCWTDAYVYDINGAHADALKEIFPKAADIIQDMHNRRKEHPTLKAVLNYYVGMLARKGYRETYNWIVQRTTRKLFKALDYCGGILVYANTDGFIVANPEELLEPSSKLGDFKCEHVGAVYGYSDKNYTVIQYGPKMKGNLRISVRNKVDLPRGKVVHYDIVRYGNVEHLENIEEETISCSLNE